MSDAFLDLLAKGSPDDYVAYTIPNCGYVPNVAISLCPTCDRVIYRNFQHPCDACELREAIRKLRDYNRGR